MKNGNATKLAVVNNGSLKIKLKTLAIITKINEIN